MKTVDTNEYMAVLQGLISEGREVGLLISGDSMAPFLVHGRDYIYFKTPDRELKKGDMVFYRRTSGQYIMHRILDIKPEGYYIIGDNQVMVEGPLDRSQIFAIVTKVKRNGQLIGPDSLIWKFYEKVWIRMIPVRRIISRVCRKLKRTVKGQE